MCCLLKTISKETKHWAFLKLEIVMYYCLVQSHSFVEWRLLNSWSGSVIYHDLILTVSLCNTKEDEFSWWNFFSSAGSWALLYLNSFRQLSNSVYCLLKQNVEQSWPWVLKKNIRPEFFGENYDLLLFFKWRPTEYKSWFDTFCNVKKDELNFFSDVGSWTCSECSHINPDSNANGLIGSSDLQNNV